MDFDGVGFGYRSGAPLFSDLTLTVRPGEHVALVGPSGSGKSTLSKLLLRLMDVEDGGIRVDGQDIRDVTLASLRRQISYVPQDPQLLHRTIAENICYGIGAPRRRRRGPGRRSTTTSCTRWAGRPTSRSSSTPCPTGTTPWWASAASSSRAASANGWPSPRPWPSSAPILVLDEATSALDSESEHLVQEALWRLMEDSTALVIAHRLSTIAHMDRIVVFDRGAIVQEGTHRQLLDGGGARALRPAVAAPVRRVPGRVSGTEPARIA